MTTLTNLKIRNNIHRAYYSDGTVLILHKTNAEELSKTYNVEIKVDNTNLKIKGRGYQTRGMSEISPGSWSIPMYRNRDDAMLGIYSVEASTARQAFEIARKACWDEFTIGS